MKMRLKLAFQRVDRNSLLYSKLICWWTKSNIYHVEVIIDNDIWVSAVEGYGVTIHNLKPLGDDWVYIPLEDVRISVPDNAKFMKWLHSQKGSKYDWEGIVFTHIFGLGLHRSYKWFCSEFSTIVLQKLKVPQMAGVSGHRETPGMTFERFSSGKEKLLYPTLWSIVKDIYKGVRT